MKTSRIKQVYSLLAAVMLFAAARSYAADVAPSATVPVTMTVTANVAGGKRMPEIGREDLVVKQGKNRLNVTEWVPAQGDRAGLELFILIDDRAESRLSLQYDDLRSFIKDQPASTLIGVGYMSNGGVQIAQDLTTDHVRAADVLRIPLGQRGAYASPYLSLVDLMKRWPVDQNRREVLMFTDGMGRDRHSGWHRGYHSDADVNTATEVAQRTGTNVFSIYTPSSPLFGRSYWAGTNGQMNLSRLSENTGGASFNLGLHSPVTIQPYLQQLQTVLNNQYLLSFSAMSGKRSGLQPINLSTEVAGVDLSTHNAVWVAGGK
jgi:hypothetical protein